jgi:aspartate/methionine/tyrosine aminotransferase
MTMPDTLARPLAARITDLAALPDMIDHGENAPTLVIDSAVEALQRGETHYTDRAGVMPLRAVVAQRLAAQTGISVDPKVITITCGLIEARSIAIRVLVKPTIVCPQMLPDVIAVAHLIGAQVVPAVVDATSDYVAYLTPADPPDQIAAILRGNALVIWDMSIAGPAAHPAQDATIAPRVTSLDSLDPLLPGWRVGWLAGSEMADRLRGFKQALTICTTSVSQWAVIEWLKT